MANNDQEAFTSLYRRYREPLFVTTVKVIGSKEDAADIVNPFKHSIKHFLAVYDLFVTWKSLIFS
jgi:hypothetical protein